jgi:hypothetical protein
MATTTTVRRRRKKRKKGRGKLIFLLLVLIGLGGWNYQRNTEIEEARPRPYKAYSDADLEQLRAAYAEQAGALASRYNRAAGRRSGTRDVDGVSEGVAQFQQVQRASRAVRDLGSQLSQEETSLQAIEAEQAYRAQIGGPVQQVVRRAFLF